MIWSGEIYYQDVKNLHFHHSLRKMVKKSRIPEQRSTFLSFFAKKIFLKVDVISFLPFMGLELKESIQESSYNVIFLFFFIKEPLEM